MRASCLLFSFGLALACVSPVFANPDVEPSIEPAVEPDTASSSASDPRVGGVLLFDPRVSFNRGNWQTGLQLGDEEYRGVWRFRGFLDVDFSPLPRGTRVRVADARDYVIRKAWYSVGPGVGVVRDLNPTVSVTASTGINRGFGSGKGEWNPWLDAGLRFPFLKDYYGAFLYQYRPGFGESAHRAAVQFRLKAL